MALSHTELHGLFTAIVTPFRDDLSVDIAALQKLVRFQLESGAAGIVPIGGTGEYPTLSRQERIAIVSACVEVADGKPIIPGVLATGFHDALDAAQDFKAAGAAAVLTVTPYYAPGPQAGMRAYFRAFQDSLDLPVLLYQIPRRTNVAALADTVEAMVEDGSIIGMKYSSYDMPDYLQVSQRAAGRFAILSGEEPLFATHVALGATGFGFDLSEDLAAGLRTRRSGQVEGGLGSAGGDRPGDRCHLPRNQSRSAEGLHGDAWHARGWSPPAAGGSLA